MSDYQLVQFEGCAVAVIAPEDLEAKDNEIERLESLVVAWRNTATLAQNEEKSLRRELAEAKADAERFRWLMRFHGEAIRKAIAPDTNPGTVVHIPTVQPGEAGK